MKSETNTENLPESSFSWGLILPTAILGYLAAEWAERVIIEAYKHFTSGYLDQEYITYFLLWTLLVYVFVGYIVHKKSKLRKFESVGLTYLIMLLISQVDISIRYGISEISLSGFLFALLITSLAVMVGISISHLEKANLEAPSMGRTAKKALRASLIISVVTNVLYGFIPPWISFFINPTYSFHDTFYARGLASPNFIIGNFLYFFLVFMILSLSYYKYKQSEGLFKRAIFLLPIIVITLCHIGFAAYINILIAAYT